MKHEPNISYIEELSGEDSDFQEKFITILKEEFPGEKVTYLNAVQQKDFETAVQIVHKLKHKFNILSMHNAYGLAVTYELELKNKDFGNDQEFMVALNVVDSYLKTI
jgi:HPt (histidine-containing phosphotransfer) domain-containing protein